jgi:hypothetical protein
MFKELGEGVETMWPEEQDVIDKLQLETVLISFRVKEVLFKKTHEQIAKDGPMWRLCWELIE